MIQWTGQQRFQWTVGMLVWTGGRPAMEIGVISRTMRRRSIADDDPLQRRSATDSTLRKRSEAGSVLRRRSEAD